MGVRPGGHQQGAGVILGAVVLEAFFCPESRETRWSGLGNWTVLFGGYHELVPASVLVSAFASRTLSYSVATSSKLFSVSGFTSPLAEDSLLGPVLPYLLPG
jgi:hypothetical protein